MPEMRRELVACKLRHQAERKCPWAAVIQKVPGGFLCFVSYVDHSAWKAEQEAVCTTCKTA